MRRQLMRSVDCGVAMHLQVAMDIFKASLYLFRGVTVASGKFSIYRDL